MNADGMQGQRPCVKQEIKFIWAFIMHGKSGFLRNPHAPLGTLFPRGLCKPSRTPPKWALRTHLSLVQLLQGPGGHCMLLHRLIYLHICVTRVS